MANELTPATRVEKLLAEILGEDYAVIPVTRIEKFLSNILGAEYDLIPATRIEKFLAKIAEEGGGGGSELINELATDYDNQSFSNFFKAIVENRLKHQTFKINSGDATSSFDLSDLDGDIHGIIIYTNVTSDANNENLRFWLSILQKGTENFYPKFIAGNIRSQSVGYNYSAYIPRTTDFSLPIETKIMSFKYTYPSNAQYHPFGFSNTYHLLYW